MNDAKKAAEEYVFPINRVCRGQGEIARDAFLAGAAWQRERDAKRADEARLGFHSPWEYDKDIAQAIRADNSDSCAHGESGLCKTCYADLVKRGESQNECKHQYHRGLHPYFGYCKKCGKEESQQECKVKELGK